MIKRLLLASVTVAACSGVALAADFPIAPEAYRPVVTPVPYFDWTGVYVGVNAGAAWAAQPSLTTIDIPTATVFPATSISSTGIAGGGQIGFNWFIVPSFVVGAEADFDALSNKTTTSLGGPVQHDFKLKFLSTARGRFGLTADRFMWYVTGGFAWGQDQVTRSQLSGTVNAAVPGTVESVTKNRYGWTAGTGIEYAFAPNWTARLEYLYAHLYSTNYTFPLAGRATSSSFEGVSLLRVGVNLKFGGGAPAVISARD